MDSCEILANCLKYFEALTEKPEKFLVSQEGKLDDIKSLVKNLYDITKESEGSSNPGSQALPQLIVKDFDEEQIWQEIELQNDDRWNHFIQEVSKYLVGNKIFTFPIQNTEDYEEDNQEDDFDEDENEDDLNDEEDEENSSEGDTIEPLKSQFKSSKSKTSIVDDKFFKLHELEAFLDAEDKKETKKEKTLKKGQYEESSEDDEDEEEEEVDLFADWESDEGMDDEEQTDLKYNDFFDKVEDGNENKQLNSTGKQKSLKRKKTFGDDSDEDDLGFDDDNESDDMENFDLGDKKPNSKQKKKVRFNTEQPSSSDDEENDGEDLENSTENIKDDNLSQYEIRQERLKKKIGHLENNLLQEKPWTMKGEVTATNRPQNSLLEEILDFDMTSRPAPVITEETTVKLQDIIIQRIKDKAWDDVERKIKPIQDVPEFRKQIVLDQEKSKLSLAQVYEQDYIKQRDALDPDADEKPEEEPKEHKEIKALMKTVFSKLEALSNFHYTPKVAIPEVKIVSNIPAINMEEVAPVAASDATLLAPEEIKSKLKGDIIGKSERSDTDKNRERRQKKLKQRQREAEREKREKTLDQVRPGMGNKYSKEKAGRLLQKVTSDRNVEKMEPIADSSATKSSTAFFTQLQEEVQNSIKSKAKVSKKKSKNELSAKKLKL